MGIRPQHPPRACSHLAAPEPRNVWCPDTSSPGSGRLAKGARPERLPMAAETAHCVSNCAPRRGILARIPEVLLKVCINKASLKCPRGGSRGARGSFCEITHLRVPACCGHRVGVICQDFLKWPPGLLVSPSIGVQPGGVRGGFLGPWFEQRGREPSGAKEPGRPESVEGGWWQESGPGAADHSTAALP